MYYTIASWLRTGHIDFIDPRWMKIRSYLWRYHWTHAESAYASAVSLMTDLDYTLLQAHEIAMAFNRQVNRRGSLFKALSTPDQNDSEV